MEYTETGCSKSGGKQADRSAYRYKVRKIVRKKFQSRLVRMRSPVRIWVAAPQRDRFSFEKWSFLLQFTTISGILNFAICLCPQNKPQTEKSRASGTFCLRRPVCAISRMAWSTCQIIRFPVFFRCGDLLFYLPDQLRQLRFALGLGLCVHIPGHALAVNDGGVAALPQVVIDPRLRDIRAVCFIK